MVAQTSHLAPTKNDRDDRKVISRPLIRLHTSFYAGTLAMVRQRVVIILPRPKDMEGRSQASVRDRPSPQVAAIPLLQAVEKDPARRPARFFSLGRFETADHASVQVLRQSVHT